jgi:hypothetical protein
MRYLAREVLEEFAAVCVGFRDARGGRWFDAEMDHNLDPESRRIAYREKHEQAGMCRSCKRPAKEGRKYCQTHLDRANARARRSQARAAA